jgi:serine/threonine protein kinase
VKEIGRGGMGAVYLAIRADELFNKQVAIKVIKRGMDTDDVLRHFRNERRILGNFDHPNIAHLLDGGSTESGLPYFVMEYVEGKQIDEYCDERCHSITDRLELFQQVCAAVSYAHRNLVVHRDLKPSNIVITKEGIPKLLDFGIAKILEIGSEEKSTVTGILLMTPEYASPEQAQGLPVNTLSDVYSLGVVLYELLTGRDPYPFKNRTPIEIARIISETQPQIPSAVIDSLVSKTREGTQERLQKRLRGDLDNIVLMALRKEPERRYQSIDQFSEDIHRHLHGLPLTASKDALLYRTIKFIKRNKIEVGASILICLSLLGGIIVSTWQAQ